MDVCVNVHMCVNVKARTCDCVRKVVEHMCMCVHSCKCVHVYECVLHGRVHTFVHLCACMNICVCTSVSVCAGVECLFNAAFSIYLPRLFSLQNQSGGEESGGSSRLLPTPAPQHLTGIWGPPFVYEIPVGRCDHC